MALSYGFAEIYVLRKLHKEKMKREQEEEEQEKIDATKFGSSVPVVSRTGRRHFFGFSSKKAARVVSAEEDRTGAGRDPARANNF